MVEHLASCRDRVGCGRRRPHGDSILVRDELRPADRPVHVSSRDWRALQQPHRRRRQPAV
jgi:hypothetical protein